LSDYRAERERSVVTSLHLISKTDDAELDVIFIHGLADDPFACWQHDTTRPKDSWPNWLATKRQNVAVYSLEYDADRSYWNGDAMPLQDRAKGVLTTLQLEELGKLPIVFVCHSLGGLVAKQLLRTANDTAKPDWRVILKQTRDVLFLATPHAGSDLASWLDRFGRIYNATATIKDLKKNAPVLLNLNEWYRENSKPLKIRSHVFYETKKIKGVLAVEPSSADPGITGVVPIPIDADHRSIVKPDRADETVCRYLLNVIDKALKKDSVVQPVPDVASHNAEVQSHLHALPPKNPDFVGREEDMARIRAALDQGGAVITAIEGMGGIGKTALGVEVANELQDEGVYPDGVPFVDLEGFSATRQPLSTKEALEALLRPIVGLEARLPDGVQGLQHLWKLASADRRMLLFLDNARDEVQLRPLLPGHPSCKVLATSRNRLDLSGITPIQLDVIAPDSAAELAHTLGNRWQQGRVSWGQMAELTQLCGYLPLPIKVTAATLGKATLLDVEAQLRKLAQVRRDALGMDQVKVILGQSVDQLTPELRVAWQKLGVFEGDFSLDAGSVVIGVDGAHDMLAELEQHHLVILSGQQRLRLHDILRALALGSLPIDDHKTAAARHAAHYKDVLVDANKLYLDGKVLDGLRLYDREQHQVHAGQRWATAELTKSDEIARLASDYTRDTSRILKLRLMERKWIDWLTIQLKSCQKISDLEGEADAIGNLGVAYMNLGENKHAIELYEQQLRMASKIGSRHAEARALGNSGLAYVNLGENERAIKLYEQQLEIVREVGPLRSVGYCLGNLGRAYRNIGEPSRAIRLCDDALRIIRDIGDSWAESYILGFTGLAYADLGKNQIAFDLFEQQLQIAKEIGYLRGEGFAQLNGAMMLDKLGNRPQAIVWARNALAIRDLVEDPNLEDARTKLAEWTGEKSTSSA